MIRLVLIILAAVMFSAGGAEAQQRAVQGEVIQLSPQMIDALNEGRLTRARSLLDAARTDMEESSYRRQLSPSQIMEFMCTGRICLCEGANDCVDLAGTGLCAPRTMDCDTHGCRCHRPEALRR